MSTALPTGKAHEAVASALTRGESYWFLAPCCGEGSKTLISVLEELDAATLCASANRPLHTFEINVGFIPEAGKDGILLFAFVPFDLVSPQQLGEALTKVTGQPYDLALADAEGPVDESLNLVAALNPDHSSVLTAMFVHAGMDLFATRVREAMLAESADA